MKQEQDMEERLLHAPFAEVEHDLQEQSFWIKLFIRPCCARPDERGARLKTQGLRSMLSGRSDFTAEQLSKLSALIDQGETWYITRFC